MESPEQDRHALFFRCGCVDAEVRGKIEKYFQIRRKSGGGECGSVRKERDGVYSIAFKHKDAQLRVLQKREHVLDLVAGPMVLTVWSSPELETPPPEADSAQPGFRKWDLTSPPSPPSAPASLPPPSGEVYELQVDSYLLRYLTESDKARKELETELDSMSCSVRLDSERERVLVWGLAQPAAADQGQSWKTEVDKLFDSYMCHYELDQRKAMALVRSCRTSEEVKAYDEVIMAVIVGKRAKVNAVLTDVCNSSPKSLGSSLGVGQTVTRRLGEAKLRLLWWEIEHGLGQKCPCVKVTRGDAGKVVLEGSAKDICEANVWISDKERLVFERIVSDLSPHLLNFLRQTYGGPRELGSYLGLGEGVEMELRDYELRIFALSVDSLNDPLKLIQDKFAEVKIGLPSCSSVPIDLQDKLKSKTREMNRGQLRTQVRFGTDGKVCLFGHAQEVEDLTEIVSEYILDQAKIEGLVRLRYPELVQHLTKLLQLHAFDYSGVTFHPVPEFTEPIVVLEGPSGNVTEVRSRLVPFLDSLVQGNVAIELPGAVRFFESSLGREEIFSIAESQKCLIHLCEPFGAALRDDGGNSSASYSLRSGLQVVVCQGDITKLDADVLVNAANEKLEHHGGVAAALSKAGGSEIQKESCDIVKNIGKIPTGDVVVTTAGNLQCKGLIHAVGPVAGAARGKEGTLVEKAVRSALNMAEQMEMSSIALPCISSGLFGVPVVVCSEAIVTAVKEFGSQGGRSVRKIILIDTRKEVVRAMKEACDRIFQGTGTRLGTPGDLEVQMDVAAPNAARGPTAGPPGVVQVEIVQGFIETQQVDCLLSPMAGHDPLSSRIGNALSRAIGPQLTTEFYRAGGGAAMPGGATLVDGLTALPCKAVCFLNLLPWDNNQHGTAVQVLRQGLRKVLDSCQVKGWHSVAVPVLGTGSVLRFPHAVVSRVLLEEVHEFDQKRTSRSPFLVRVVIHPIDKESNKAFQSAQKGLNLRGFAQLDGEESRPEQASSYRHVSATNNDIQATVGGIKLQILFGDIIDAGTDVIVNTTDFSANHSGVSKAILTAAGATVQGELAQMGSPADDMCATGPGQLRCREIIHARFKCSVKVIEKNCRRILEHCETKGFQSVAFPAVNTGAAGMDYVQASKAMLDAIESAVKDINPKSLSFVRIVILQQPVFQVFRSELETRFGQSAPRRSDLREKAKQLPKKLKEMFSRNISKTSPQDHTFISSKPKAAVLSVICCRADTVATVKSELKSVLQKQLVEREVKASDFSRLQTMALEAVLTKVRVTGVSLEYRIAPERAKAKGAAEARPEDVVYVLGGLKEDVLSVTELIGKAVQDALWKDNLDKSEAMCALFTQWSIQGVDGAWQRLTPPDNYALENAYANKELVTEILAPDGTEARVNLEQQEATSRQGTTYKVRRSESTATLDLPENWEPMHNEDFRKVELHPNSQEYQDVARGFHATAKYNIKKIERVQNVHQWRAFTVFREWILSKNGQEELGEKFLYHGTSAASCDCIERGRFDRSFAGTHVAMFGMGVYFAVKASYSAGRFSPADTSGLKRLYVARVMTGRFTRGSSAMKCPPPRGNDPIDRFDSLVDNQGSPSMFVIFHDDQAYPEYLITFT